MRKALFPGTFDPFTLGHYDIVKRGLDLFDEVYVGIGVNSSKKNMFTEKERVEMIQACFPGEERLKVTAFKGLTVNFAKDNGIQFLLRGLRNGVDLEYEKPIALINRKLIAAMDTIFLLPDPETAHISSTLVREVIRYKGPVEALVPAAIAAWIDSKPRE